MVGKQIGCAYLEVLARLITQRTKNKGNILICLDRICAAVSSCGSSTGQAVGVSITDVRISCGALCYIRKRKLPISGKSLFFLAQQTHQHDDSLIAGGGLFQCKNRSAIGIGACSPEQTQLIEDLGGLCCFIVCSNSRGN